MTEQKNADGDRIEQLENKLDMLAEQIGSDVEQEPEPEPDREPGDVESMVAADVEQRNGNPERPDRDAHPTPDRPDREPRPDVEPVDDLEQEQEHEPATPGVPADLHGYMLAAAPYGLLGGASVAWGLARSGVLAVPSVVSTALLLLGLLGLGLTADRVRRTQRDLAADPESHPDERDCMLPRCDGTVETIGRDGTVVETPECRLCGTRYDVTVELTDPEEYLDVTSERSVDPTDDGDDEQSDESGRSLPGVPSYD